MSPRRHPLVHELVELLNAGSDRPAIDTLLQRGDRLLEDLHDEWPAWARAVADRLEDMAGGGGGHGGRPSGHSDPTAATLIRNGAQIERRDLALGYLEQGVASLAAALQIMATTPRTANASKVAEDIAAARCTGGMGLDGAVVWGDPTCRSIHSGTGRKGLCDRHWLRYRRWQAAERAALAESALGRR